MYAPNAPAVVDRRRREASGRCASAPPFHTEAATHPRPSVQAQTGNGWHSHQAPGDPCKVAERFGVTGRVRYPLALPIRIGDARTVPFAADQSHAPPRPGSESDRASGAGSLLLRRSFPRQAGVRRSTEAVARQAKPGSNGGIVAQPGRCSRSGDARFPRLRGLRAKRLEVTREMPSGRERRSLTISRGQAAG